VSLIMFGRLARFWTYCQIKTLPGKDGIDFRFLFSYIADTSLRNDSEEESWITRRFF
jgi:hypothetical protein